MEYGRLSRVQLSKLLNALLYPKKHELTQLELDHVLIDFCAGCPDPVEARWLVVECLNPMTDDELLDRALGMAWRSMDDVPTSIVPAEHRARAASN